MKVLRSFLGIFVMIAGVLGLVLSLAGLVSVWVVKPAVVANTSSTIDTLNSSIGTSQDVMEITAQALGATVDSVDALSEMLFTTALTVEDTQPDLDEFDLMRDFVSEVGAIEWGIEIPSVTGALEEHPDLMVPHETAVPYLEYAFGGGLHGSSEGYACGRHLLAVMPDGQAVKCGFYRDRPLGSAVKSLKECWLKMEHTPLSLLECRDCAFLEECRGGCRFRAPHPLAPDPVMCKLYGILNLTISQILIFLCSHH